MYKFLVLALCTLFAFPRISKADSDSGATCYVKTTENRCCVFPFIYNQKKYYSCITVKNNGYPWCGTTPDYDLDGEWDHCVGMEMQLTADDQAWVYANGKYLGNDNGNYREAQKYTLPLDTELLAVYVKNSKGGPTGLLARLSSNVVTDAHWKCTTQFYTGWQRIGTNGIGVFNDYKWPYAVDHGASTGDRQVQGIPSWVHWIGVHDKNAAGFYCRRKISFLPQRPAIQGEGKCDKPLGMFSGWIKSKDIKTSSELDFRYTGNRGRLHLWTQGEYKGAWATAIINTHQWLQVDFGRPTIVTGVATQGSFDEPRWVKTYHLSYGKDENSLMQYKVNGKLKIFQGNDFKNAYKRNAVKPSIETRYIRINPMTYYGHIALRVEFYGCTKTCKVDLGFLLDESGSVADSDFEREKSFVINIADLFSIGKHAARFGVISYSNNAKLDVKFNDFSGDRPLLQYAISTLLKQGGRTFTDAALKLAKEQLYTAANGARNGVAKVLIVITDGKSSGGIDSLREPVKSLKDSSVNIFSIGVGSNLRKEELELMAADKSHVYYVKNMAELQDIADAITAQSCSDYSCRYVKCHYSEWSSWSATCGQNVQRTKTLHNSTDHVVSLQGGCSGLPQSCDDYVIEAKHVTCPCKAVKCSWGNWSDWSATCGRMTRQRFSIATEHIVNRPSGCQGVQKTCPANETESVFASCCKADVGFILDDSGSLSNTEFEEEKDFVGRLAKGFSNFGPNGIQMAAIRFSNGADLDVRFSDHTDKNKFHDAVKAIIRRGGVTNTDKALMKAHNEMFSVSNGARKGVTKVLFVVSDGGSTAGIDSLRDPVKVLEGSGVNIFSIGVGSRIVQQELDFMASDPIKSHVYSVKNMKELSTLLEQLATSSCKKYTCKYVTCDYSQWSGWSKSCGAGISRVKNLTKSTTHTMDKQGGCSGLLKTCEPQQIETKDEMCSCKSVKCSWEAWSEWSHTCGSATRQRKSKATDQIVQQASCDGLKTKCPAPELENRTLNCACPSVKCVWKQWSEWSATCGFQRRTRSISAVPTTVDQPSCEGLPLSCSEKPEVQEQSGPMCKCNSVKCDWGPWSDWSASCGDATRTRKMQPTQVIVERPTCDEVPTTCASTPETEQRNVQCTCPTVMCSWNNWGSWSATCGQATRQRTIKTEYTTVQQASCDGLPQVCLEQPETEQREIVCTCPTVICTWNNWGDWSASCGRATRQRTIHTQYTTVQQASCDGLPQYCSEPPETESRETMCTCPTVMCTWNDWGDWSASCGHATRLRSIRTDYTTVQQPSCDGLPTSCLEDPETESRVTMCKCPTVHCTLGPWAEWSNDCGKVYRERQRIEAQVVEEKDSCDGLPQHCDKTPVREEKTMKDCELCFTVECKYSPWSKWSATCGPATRTRTQITEEIEIEKASCDGLPLECHGQTDENQSRDTPTCPATSAPPTVPATTGTK